MLICQDSARFFVLLCAIFLANSIPIGLKETKKKLCFNLSTMMLLLDEPERSGGGGSGNGN
jgi:hypothetical protein